MAKILLYVCVMYHIYMTWCLTRKPTYRHSGLGKWMLDAEINEWLIIATGFYILIYVLT